MKLQTIKENEAGQRFDKYLKKLLPGAPPGFLYKMLRKKNITLNGHKASGNEKTALGDEVKLFLSDETFDKYASGHEGFHHSRDWPGSYKGSWPSIIYEDTHILLMDKPAGLLSQPDKSGEPTVCEYLTDYLTRTGKIHREELLTFHPAVVNRLDRNTSGLVAAGKTLAGLQELSEAIRSRNIIKYYLCIVCGVVREEKYIEGYLYKDTCRNVVTVRRNEAHGPQDKLIRTRYKPLLSNGICTLLEVELITGRTHQIRAHLASEGFPVLGDMKYGKGALHRKLSEAFGLKYQLLHASEMDFKEMKGTLSYLSGKRFEACMPDLFREIMESGPGIL